MSNRVLSDKTINAIHADAIRRHSKKAQTPLEWERLQFSNLALLMKEVGQVASEVPLVASTTESDYLRRKLIKVASLVAVWIESFEPQEY
ncbi:MAG TPA: hypothetical protein V6C65_17980 [Allocoleopsis sp.]